jgi:hypothetical protein
MVRGRHWRHVRFKEHHDNHALTALFVAAPLPAWGLLLTAGLLLIGTVALGALALQVAALVGVEVISGRRQHARP